MFLILKSAFYITIFIVGIIIGSFLNDGIYYFLYSESMTKQHSNYLLDRKYLKWYDMLLILDWAVYTKKNKDYRLKVFNQHLIVEIINSILYIVTFIINGVNVISIIYCLMESAFFLIAIIDWCTYEIPFSINIFLGVLGVIATILDIEHFVSHLIGFMLISGILLILYYMTEGRAIGGGDIKLTAVCGLIIGWKDIVIAFFIGCIIGSAAHIIRMRKNNTEHIFAMGPYLAIGIFLAVLWGEKWIAVYL